MIPPTHGSYYRVTKPFDGIKTGELVFLWKDAEEGTIQGVCRDKSYYFSADALVGLEPCPEGVALRQKELADLLSSGQELQRQEIVGEEIPLLTDARHPHEPGTAALALIRPDLEDEIIQRKKKVTQAQSQALSLNKKTQALLQETAKVAAVMAGQWKEKIQALQYVLDSLQLYLGKDEEVVCIQEGERAPAETPITIRQITLCMDEECALMANSGGLDFTTLEEFDRWLCQPEHLQQLLPEEKGIIGLRLRRNDKFYANVDIWTQMLLQAQNRLSFILIRNGQCIWRFWNEINLGDYLIPTQREFEELFLDHWSKETMRPGTREYQIALNRAKGRTKHYLQIILLLQGIIDRTRIFQPLSVERINLMDPNPDPDLIRILRDAEKSLGSGKLSWHDWLKRCNSRLDVGKRIVFGGTSYHRYAYSREDVRTQPKGAEWPDANTLFVLQASLDPSSNSYRITYPYQTWRGKEGTASFTLRPTDRFVLNFDDASLEDLEFYFNDRASRHHYLDNITLLKAALQLKRMEIAKEQPFLDLLRRQAVERFKIVEDRAQAYLEKIVPWWKQHTRHSYSLTDKETRAYKQILAEMEQRIKIDENTAGPEILQKIKAQSADWIVIAKTAKRNVVCVRRYPDSKGYVCIETWDVKTQQKISTQEWAFLGTNTARWQVMEAHPAWENWPKDGRKERYLRRAEREQMVADLRAALPKQGHFQILCAITASEKAFYLYGVGGFNGREEWKTLSVPWQRAQRNQPPTCNLWHPAHLSCHLDPDLQPAEENQLTGQPESVRVTCNFSISNAQQRDIPPEMQKFPFTAFGDYILSCDEAAVVRAGRWAQKKRVRSNRAAERHATIRQVEHAIRSALEHRYWNEKRNRYLQDGGQPELWASHKKTLQDNVPQLQLTEIDDCLELLVDANIPLSGKTIQEVWQLARAHGWAEKNPVQNKILPLNLIVPTEAETEQLLHEIKDWEKPEEVG